MKLTDELLKILEADEWEAEYPRPRRSPYRIFLGTEIEHETQERSKRRTRFPEYDNEFEDYIPRRDERRQRRSDRTKRA